MGRSLRLLQVLGVNSVPALGFFAADWTASTALALYWCENVLVTLLVGLRLVVHRRRTGKRGHWEADLGSERPKRASRSATFLAGFLSAALIFTAAHGLFLGLILFLLIPQEFPDAGGVDIASLGTGLGFISVLLLLGLAYDLVGIDTRSFAWVKRLAERVLGRVILVHLTIIFGMMGMAWLGGPRGFFLVFAGFKTLSDLTAMTGGGHEEPSSEPPGWLVGTIRTLGGKGNAEDFSRHYRDAHRTERRQAAAWEERREI